MEERSSYHHRRDRLKVPFPDVHYDDPAPLIEAITHGEWRVFVISDSHLFHTRLWGVLRPTGEGGRDPRNTELILSSWRKAVRPDDVVLHLGDVALGIPVDSYRESIGWLPGEVWLLPGNHDRIQSKLSVFREMGWKLVRPFTLEQANWRVHFSHEPIPSAALPEGVLNVHGHIHHNPAYNERYLNACVEWLGYQPVELQPLLLELTLRSVAPTSLAASSSERGPGRKRRRLAEKRLEQIAKEQQAQSTKSVGETFGNGKPGVVRQLMDQC